MVISRPPGRHPCETTGTTPAMATPTSPDDITLWLSMSRCPPGVRPPDAMPPIRSRFMPAPLDPARASGGNVNGSASRVTDRWPARASGAAGSTPGGHPAITMPPSEPESVARSWMMGSASGEKDGIRGAPHGDPWGSPESRITKAIRASSAARFDGFRLRPRQRRVRRTRCSGRRPAPPTARAMVPPPPRVQCR